jgi:site-specific DNA-methyltransferase (adenine-specific)/modification methylase
MTGCGRKIGPYDCCTVVCGDCLELMKSLPDGCVDAVITDPQYQLASGKKATTMNAFAGRGKNYLKGVTTIPHDWGSLHGDDSPLDPSPFLRFPKVILWGAIHYGNRLPNSTSWLIWDKRGSVASDDNADCEMAWSNLGGPARIYRQLWKGICRAGEENIAISGAKLHPFQKPVALMRWCIERAGDCETILDAFLGSGTTAVAAKKLGRHFLGFEIEQKYVDIANERIALVEAQRNLFERRLEQPEVETKGGVSQ